MRQGIPEIMTTPFIQITLSVLRIQEFPLNSRDHDKDTHSHHGGVSVCPHLSHEAPHSAERAGRGKRRGSCQGRFCVILGLAFQLLICQGRRIEHLLCNSLLM